MTAAVKRSDIPVAVLLRACQQMKDESDASIEAAGGIRVALVSGWRTMTPTQDLPSRLPQYPYKVVLARIEQLASRKHGALLDWGVVINRPWLTDAGKAKLAELESAAGALA